MVEERWVREYLKEIKKKTPQKCPLTVIDKTKNGYIVRLSKHIWQAEADCDCELEQPLIDEFDLPRKFKKKKQAVDYANKVSDKMDLMAEESGTYFSCKKR